MLSATQLIDALDLCGKSELLESFSYRASLFSLEERKMLAKLAQKLRDKHMKGLPKLSEAGQELAKTNKIEAIKLHYKKTGSLRDAKLVVDAFCSEEVG